MAPRSLDYRHELINLFRFSHCLQSPEIACIPDLQKPVLWPVCLGLDRCYELSCLAVPLIFMPLEVFISFSETHKTEKVFTVSVLFLAYSSSLERRLRLGNLKPPSLRL